MSSLNSSKILCGAFYAIFCSLVGSILYSLLNLVSSQFLRFLSKYSLGLLTNFVDAKIRQAATLETMNYSFFILVLLFLSLFLLVFLIYMRKDKINQIRNEIIKGNSSNKIKKVLGILFNLGIIIFFLCGMLFVMGESMILNDIANFKHNLRILSPYMTVTEKEMIISEWSRMNSFSDYKNIYKKLNKLAKDQNLELHYNKFN